MSVEGSLDGVHLTRWWVVVSQASRPSALEVASFIAVSSTRLAVRPWKGDSTKKASHAFRNSR
eukprot:3932688-Amphidinium_carterae.1